MLALLWSVMFMILSVGGSAIALMALIGLPITPDIRLGIATLAGLVVVSGVALLALPPPVR